MKLNIRSIANMAGVSPATVSLVLNNKPGVGEEKRTLIKQLLLDNGYHIKEISENATKQNSVASFIGRTKYKIVFVNYKSSNWLLRRKDNFLSRVIDGLEKGCEKCNCDLTMVNANHLNLEEVLSGILNKEPDGVIFLGTEFMHEPLSLMAEYKVPFVVIDRFLDESSINTINTDNRQALYRAVRHLKDLGHKRIAYLNARPITGALQNRMEEFCFVMDKLNLPYSEDSFIETSYIQDEAEKDLEDFLRGKKELPTAFMSCNDVIAAAAITSLQRAGIRVPEEVSVVGFDDSGVCDMISPNLTSVHSRVELMSEVAISRICEMRNSNCSDVQKILLETKLICRNSTARAREGIIAYE